MCLCLGVTDVIIRISRNNFNFHGFVDLRVDLKHMKLRGYETFEVIATMLGRGIDLMQSGISDLRKSTKKVKKH